MTRKVPAFTIPARLSHQTLDLKRTLRMIRPFDYLLAYTLHPAPELLRHKRQACTYNLDS
jgi:hypothetical protein